MSQSCCGAGVSACCCELPTHLPGGVQGVSRVVRERDVRHTIFLTIQRVLECVCCYVVDVNAVIVTAGDQEIFGAVEVDRVDACCIVLQESIGLHVSVYLSQLRNATIVGCIPCVRLLHPSIS